jgi:copper(I)-binding protein
VKKLVIAAAVAFTFAISQAEAAEFKIDSLVIESPWARATPKGATIGGGYLEIKNNGTTADRLIRGSVSVAKLIQIHNMTVENGIAKMREVTAGIEIKPGGTIKSEPGASHLMFVNLMQPLHEGEKVRGTLTFEHAGTIDIEYAVVGTGAKGPVVSVGRMGAADRGVIRSSGAVDSVGEAVARLQLR